MTTTLSKQVAALEAREAHALLRAAHAEHERDEGEKEIASLVVAHGEAIKRTASVHVDLMAAQEELKQLRKRFNDLLPPALFAGFTHTVERDHHLEGTRNVLKLPALALAAITPDQVALVSAYAARSQLERKLEEMVRDIVQRRVQDFLDGVKDVAWRS